MLKSPVFFAVLSAFFAGLTALFAKCGVSGINSNLATALRTSVILFITWGIVFAMGGWKDFSSIDRKNLCFLILSGIATGLSWLCYFRALALGEVSKVAPIDKLSVVFAMILAFLFLGETVRLPVVIGGGLIVLGTLVIIWK